MLLKRFNLSKFLLQPGLLMLMLGLILGCSKQNSDHKQQLNGIHLGALLSDLEQEFYFYDGSESFYDDYPTIRESLLNNLRSGIKQGVYEGENRLQWEQYQADQLRVTFFQDSLYQVQWNFTAYEDVDIAMLSDYLQQRFEQAYGNPEVMDYPDFTLSIWQDSTYYLSIFQEADLELTVEFRGAKTLEELKKRKKGNAL